MGLFPFHRINMMNTRKIILRTKRHFLTLIELLIVITILAMVSGVVGVQIQRTLREQRFNTEVAIVLDKLRLAQELMLILRTDAHVKFMDIPDKNEIALWLDVETPLDSLKKDIVKPVNLKTIRAVEFKDALEYKTKMGELDICFLSGGNVMSQGVLRLADSVAASSGVLERFITLSGHPKPLHIALKREFENSDEVFDERLTAITQQELQDAGIFKP